jgi:hypothetical protein
MGLKMFFFFLKVSQLLWKGALDIGARKSIAMVIVAKTFNSDHPNYVFLY